MAKGLKYSGGNDPELDDEETINVTGIPELPDASEEDIPISVSPKSTSVLDSMLASERSPDAIRAEQKLATDKYLAQLKEAQGSADVGRAFNSVALGLKPLAERRSWTDTYFNHPQQSSGIDDMVKNSNEALTQDVKSKQELLEKYQASKEKQAENDLNRIKSLIQTKAKVDATKESASQRRDDKATANNQKKTESQNKAFTELTQHLEGFRGNQAVQQAQLNNFSAQKALALVKNKNPNDLTTQDLSLFAGEVAKIATGGVPTEHGMQQLTPNNLDTKIAEIKNFLTSNPTPAQAGEYIKHNMSYLEDLQKESKKMVKDYREGIAKGYKNRISPEDYAGVARDYELTGQNSIHAGGAPASDMTLEKFPAKGDKTQLSPPLESGPDPVKAIPKKVKLGEKKIGPDGVERVRTERGWEKVK